jgi:hypothetical protein
MEKITFCGTSYTVIFTKGAYYRSDQIKKDEMGRACNTHGEMIDAYKTSV